jgi:hypothetical protein
LLKVGPDLGLSLLPTPQGLPEGRIGAIDRAGKRLALETAVGVSVWDLSPARRVADLAGHGSPQDQPYRGSQLSPDGHWLVSIGRGAGGDRTRSRTCAAGDGDPRARCQLQSRAGGMHPAALRESRRIDRREAAEQSAVQQQPPGHEGPAKRDIQQTTRSTSTRPKSWRTSMRLVLPIRARRVTCAPQP